MNELRQVTLEAEKREQAALAETKTILAEIERLKVLLTKQCQFLTHDNLRLRSVARELFEKKKKEPFYSTLNSYYNFCTELAKRFSLPIGVV